MYVGALPLFFCGSSDDVVYAYVVIIGQLYEDFYGNIDLAELIFGISSLLNVQIVRQVLLFFIIIFPQISDVWKYHHIMLLHV